MLFGLADTMLHEAKAFDSQVVKASFGRCPSPSRTDRLCLFCPNHDSLSGNGRGRSLDAQFDLN